MKKVLNFIKNNCMYIIFTFALILLNIGIIFTVAKDEKNIILILNCLLTIIFGIVFSVMYKKVNSENIKIEKLFLITNIVIGILYLFSFPYGTIMDEQNHFLRTYEITGGHLVSELNDKGQGGREMSSDFLKLPMTVVDHKTQLEVLNVKDTKTDKIFYEFSNTALYSFVCYIPQVIGVGIGNLLNLPFIIQVFLGRITNFAVYTAIVYFSIKYLPFNKQTAYVIATLPITFQEAISLSPDALTIAMSFAIVSFTLFMIFTKKDQMSKWQIAIMSLICIIVSMCKIIYLPLCLMIFLIPKERFGSLKKKNIIIITLAIFVVIINLGWTMFASRFLDSHVHDSSSSEQVAFLISKPFKFIPIVLNTMNLKGSEIIKTLFGALLGYYTVRVFLPYIYALILLFLFSLFTENKKQLKFKNILLYVFIFLSTCILMCASLYIQWTPLRSDVIDGIQGRYFIPLLFILSLFVTNKKITFKGKILNNYTLLFIAMVNISAITEIVLYFA